MVFVHQYSLNLYLSLGMYNHVVSLTWHVLYFWMSWCSESTSQNGKRENQSKRTEVPLILWKFLQSKEWSLQWHGYSKVTDIYPYCLFVCTVCWKISPTDDVQIPCSEHRITLSTWCLQAIYIALIYSVQCCLPQGQGGEATATTVLCTITHQNQPHWPFLWQQSI